METDYINQSEKCKNIIKTIRVLEEDLSNANNSMEIFETILKIKIGLKILNKEENMFLDMVTNELK